MTADPTTYSFTKLVVSDVDALAPYYREVFGLADLHRVQAEIAGEPIDEIILGRDGVFAGGLILLSFTDRPAPVAGEVILGFVTPDIDDLFARAVAAGGTVAEAPHESVAGPGRVVVGFLRDPEGHLAEIVQRG